MTSQPRQALADFSNILKMHEVAPSLKSGALYGRALAFAGLGERENAVVDCTAVIQMTEATNSVRTVALMLRAELRESVERQAAIDDYTAVLQINEVPDETATRALFRRGLLYGSIDQGDMAIADFSAMIERHDVPIATKSEALLFRGMSLHTRKQEDRALNDYTSVIQTSGALRRSSLGSSVSTRLGVQPPGRSRSRDCRFFRSSRHGRRATLDSRPRRFSVVVSHSASRVCDKKHLPTLTR